MVQREKLCCVCGSEECGWRIYVEVWVTVAKSVADFRASCFTNRFGIAAAIFLSSSPLHAQNTEYHKDFNGFAYVHMFSGDKIVCLCSICKFARILNVKFKFLELTYGSLYNDMAFDPCTHKLHYAKLYVNSVSVHTMLNPCIPLNDAHIFSAISA